MSKSSRNQKKNKKTPLLIVPAPPPRGKLAEGGSDRRPGPPGPFNRRAARSRALTTRRTGSSGANALRKKAVAASRRIPEGLRALAPPAYTLRIEHEPNRQTAAHTGHALACQHPFSRAGSLGVSMGYAWRCAVRACGYGVRLPRGSFDGAALGCAVGAGPVSGSGALTAPPSWPPEHGELHVEVGG